MAVMAAMAVMAVMAVLAVDEGLLLPQCVSRYDNSGVFCRLGLGGGWGGRGGEGGSDDDEPGSSSQIYPEFLCGLPETPPDQTIE